VPRIRTFVGGVDGATFTNLDTIAKAGAPAAFNASTEQVEGFMISRLWAVSLGATTQILEEYLEEEQRRETVQRSGNQTGFNLFGALGCIKAVN